MNKPLKVRKGSIDEVVNLSEMIPELSNPHRKEVYEKRMFGKKSLILVAEVDQNPVGFKVGYDKFENNSDFYTWMGGVLPNFRKSGIADILAKEQEKWARKNNFRNIILKTRNRHQGMLIFAIKRDFKIIDIDKRANIDEHRILLKKALFQTKNDPL